MDSLAASLRSLLETCDTEAVLAQELLKLVEEYRPLTPRQREAAELLLEGCDTPEIARRMNVGPRTVKAFMSQLFRRYGLEGSHGRHPRLQLALLLARRQAKGEAW